MTLDIARRNRPWVANDPADTVPWDGPQAGDATGGVLADIAVPAVLVPGDCRTTEVDELFRRDGTLRCVVLQTADRPVLVDRAAFEAALTGRLGYGRLLHSRRAVIEMVTEETLVMPHDAPIAAAGAAVLARRSPGTVADAVVVRMPGGRIAVAHVSTIFERLAHDYAYQSLHDPLTHLPNRLYLMEQFHQSADGDWSAVLFVDLDRFKDVNDELGHGAGDQVLAQYAERLRSSCRSNDVVARLGGDEFAVLTAAPLSPTQTLALAERLVLEAAAPFTVTVTEPRGSVVEQLVTIGASVGVAHADRSHADGRLSSLDVLLKHADLAMYAAKGNGGDSYQLFENSMRPGTDRLNLEVELRDAALLGHAERRRADAGKQGDQRQNADGARHPDDLLERCLGRRNDADGAGKHTRHGRFSSDGFVHGWGLPRPASQLDAESSIVPSRTFTCTHRFRVPGKCLAGASIGAISANGGVKETSACPDL